jgi:hypothetical protein
MQRTLLLVGTAVVAALCPLSTGNVLVNPGFETGDFTGWTLGGNSPGYGVTTAGTLIPGVDFAAYGDDTVEVHSGTYAAYALVQCGGGNQGGGIPTCQNREFVDLTQTVSVTPGQAYSVGFWEANNGNSAFGQSAANGGTQIYVDGVGILPSSFNTISTQFTELSGIFNTGTQTSVTITFEIDGSGSATAGVSLDDFFANDVGISTPEPQTWELMGAGLVSLLWAIKRRGAVTRPRGRKKP